MLVGRGRGVGLDVGRQLDRALEVPVLDLHLLIGPARGRTAPLPGDEQRASARHDLDRLGRDAGDLDVDAQLRGILRPVDVDRRPEAAAVPHEPRNLPEVGEQLLDLALQPVDVARHRRKRTQGRTL